MHWIGLDMPAWKNAGCDPKDRITRATFSYKLNLQSNTEKKQFSLASVNRYRLAVNGHTVMNGPARSPRMQCYLDNIDLSDVLHAGENRVEILVESYPSQPADADHEGPQNLYRYDKGPMIAVKSEAWPEMEKATGWTVRPDRSFSPDGSMHMLAGPTECIHFQREEADALPAADLGSAGSNPWGEIILPEILPKPIPNLIRKAGGFTQGQTIHADCGACETGVFETETLTTAIPVFEILGGNGAEIHFTYAESYVHEDGEHIWKDIRSDSTGVIKGIVDTVYPCGGRRHWEPLWFRAFRYIHVSVKAAEEPVTVRPLGFIELRYPLQVRTAVTSPDKWVGQLYQISRRTLENCMHDSYEDCPYYEQLQYLMDTRLEAVFTHRLTGDILLSRQAIRLFAASRTSSGLLQARYPSARAQIIPEFSLFFLEMLLDDYMQTADSDFVRTYLPVAYGIVQVFQERISSSGMFSSMGWWEFADWTKEWSSTFGTPTAATVEESALHNLHFAYAVRCFAILLRELGESEQAQSMNRLAGRVATAVHLGCFDNKRQMYREGRTTKQYSQHTQVWAVLCGLAEGEIARNALRHALQDPDVVKCSFCMQFYLFRALEKAGIYEETMPLWASWRQLIAQDLTTIPESPGQPRSDCHGWGALPLYEFPAVWLGVNPGEPGWKSIHIHPRTDMVEHLSGTCYTPLGPVFVSWTRISASRIHLWIQTPPKADTEVRMPDGQMVSLKNGSYDGEIEVHFWSGNVK